MVFLYILVIPLISAIIIWAFNHKKITLKEFGIQLVVMSIIAASSSYIIYNNKTSDIEVIHGQVVSKDSHRTSCSHSYSCHCRTVSSGSGKNRSSRRVCQTCHEHSYDINWTVQSTVGSLNISRIDRQGLREPPRFSQVVIGEAYATTNTYENYIKGSPDTLFKRQGLVKKYEKQLLAYPSNVYDYYRINRMVSDKTPLVNYNHQIDELNKELGASKQASVGLVILHNKSPEYFYALEEKWIGGKKNDIIPVISVSDDGTIQWVNIMAWAKKGIFKVKLRDNLLEAKNIQNEKAIFEAIRKQTTELYVRKPMKDFEYLKDTIKPTFNEWLVAMIIGLCLSMGMSYLFWKEDLFNEE